MNIEETPISTNGTEISGTIRATYYKNGERNIEENIKHGLGYEGVVEPVIVASRGRNPTNPSDRTVGSPTEQRLEVNMSGCSNTITTVEKDNYVLEPETVGIKQATQKGFIECEVGGWQTSVTPHLKNEEEEFKEMDK